MDDFGNFQMATLTQTAFEVEVVVVVEHTTPQSVCDAIAVAGCWESLDNEAEHSHLHSALMQKIVNRFYVSDNQ